MPEPLSMAHDLSPRPVDVPGCAYCGLPAVRHDLTMIHRFVADPWVPVPGATHTQCVLPGAQPAPGRPGPEL